jgi:hypothetical protein
MKLLSSTLALSGALLAFAISAQNANAQAEPKTDGAQKGGTRGPGPGPGRGNFDPEEMRKRINDRMRESFDVKNDDEWKLISERIEKVSEARRGTGGGIGGFPGGAPGGFRGGPPGGGAPDGGGATRTARTGGGGGSTEQQELQRAIEAKAPNDELKSKLAKLRESRKASEAKLEKEQAELLEVLSVRQEAVAVMFGLLK